MINLKLKQAIINYIFIFDNVKDFQLHNLTSTAFKAYIYDEEGNYLIGGEEVANFIRDAITLITK
jgi:hypothetical protein